MKSKVFYYLLMILVSAILSISLDNNANEVTSKVKNTHGYKSHHFQNGVKYIPWKLIAWLIISP
jgi:hypothetical protein